MEIAYTKPSITQLEVDYATDAAENGWGSNCYDYIFRFEEEFANYVGAKYAIATSSCTGAMTLGLHAAGIGPGDEVILADTNWIATASPIVHAGAKPVFVDILPDTWCIDPIKAEMAITKHTKAIVATHLYGNLCDMDALLEICREHNIILIEDAAEAIGSIYKGKRAGSIGVFSTFSFHGTKTLTTGEGGMFLTNDPKLYESVITLNNHGRKKQQDKQFWADINGFKFKMSNLQAAIGCAQLERISELVLKKQNIFNKYRSIFDSYPFVSMNHEQLGSKIGCWMPNIVFSKDSKITRELLLNEFKKEAIDARVFFWPLSALPMFEKVPGNEHSYDIPRRAINLPSFHDIKDNEIGFIADVIHKIIKNHA